MSNIQNVFNTLNSTLSNGLKKQNPMSEKLTDTNAFFFGQGYNHLETTPLSTESMQALLSEIDEMQETNQTDKPDEILPEQKSIITDTTYTIKNGVLKTTYEIDNKGNVKSIRVCQPFDSSIFAGIMSDFNDYICRIEVVFEATSQDIKFNPSNPPSIKNGNFKPQEIVFLNKDGRQVCTKQIGQNEGKNNEYFIKRSSNNEDDKKACKFKIDSDGRLVKAN